MSNYNPPPDDFDSEESEQPPTLRRVGTSTIFTFPAEARNPRPANPSSGTLFYDSSQQAIYVYLDGDWITISHIRDYVDAEWKQIMSRSSSNSNSSDSSTESSYIQSNWNTGPIEISPSLRTAGQRERTRQADRNQRSIREEGTLVETESKFNKQYTKKPSDKYEKPISYSKPRKLMII